MKFSVSLINSFFNYISGTKNQYGRLLVSENDIIDSIKRIRVDKPRMSFGTAFHEIIANPLKYIKDDGYHFKYDLNADKSYIYRFEGDSLFEFESNINRYLTSFEIPNYYDFNDIQISMRYDAIAPSEILEFKTEYSAVGFENGICDNKYLLSMQHQIYMLSLEMLKSSYHVFQFLALNIKENNLSDLFTLKKKVINQIDFKLINYRKIPAVYNSNFEVLLKHVINELIDFVKINDLGGYCQRVII